MWFNVLCNARLHYATTKYEYHFKGHEPYVVSLHALICSLTLSFFPVTYSWLYYTHELFQQLSSTCSVTYQLSDYVFLRRVRISIQVQSSSSVHYVAFTVIYPLKQIEATVKVARKNLLSQIDMYEQQERAKSSSEADKEKKVVEKMENDREPEMNVPGKGKVVTVTNETIQPKQEL